MASERTCGLHGEILQVTKMPGLFSDEIEGLACPQCLLEQGPWESTEGNPESANIDASRCT